MDALVQNPGLKWIFQEIISYLPAYDLFHCRQVSKSWKIFIDEELLNEFQIWKQAYANDNLAVEYGVAKLLLNHFKNSDWRQEIKIPNFYQSCITWYEPTDSETESEWGECLKPTAGNMKYFSENTKRFIYV